MAEITGTRIAEICFVLALMCSVLQLSSSSVNVDDNSIKKIILSKELNNTTAGFVRKLLSSPDEDGITMNRAGQTCSKNNIVITAGVGTPLPTGIPTYMVVVQNVCATGCSISNIHLSCGSFTSAILINPKIFRRIAVDDCLVNNGDPLGAGDSLKFTYANTSPYPLAVSSLTCS